MRKDLADRFSRDVENFRTMLMQHARKSEWDKFRAYAGKLFDYCEHVEVVELKHRFFKVFNLVLVLLAVIIVAIIKTEAAVPEGSVIVLMLSGFGFELYFLLAFRMYMRRKARYYKLRKGRFVGDIEQDFKRLSMPASREPFPVSASPMQPRSNIDYQQAKGP